MSQYNAQQQESKQTSTRHGGTEIVMWQIKEVKNTFLALAMMP
jgi:hypothetical protein